MMFAQKKNKFNIASALSFRWYAAISQLHEPTINRTYPANIMPNATVKDPRMLVTVPVHGRILFITVTPSKPLCQGHRTLPTWSRPRNDPRIQHALDYDQSFFAPCVIKYQFINSSINFPGLQVIWQSARFAHPTRYTLASNWINERASNVLLYMGQFMC